MNSIFKISFSKEVNLVEFHNDLFDDKMLSRRIFKPIKDIQELLNIRYNLAQMM